MKTRRLLLFIILSACAFSCKVHLGKSPREKKRADLKCDGKNLRTESNAIHPKSLKVEYFAVNTAGDTVMVKNYKKNDLSLVIAFSMLGYDTIIPLTAYKKKPFTGSTLFLLNEDGPNISMPGCYKVISTYKDGLPLYKYTYYPNGALMSMVKGINRGMASILRLNYDFNGVLLRRELHQPGIYFIHAREQFSGKFNTETRMGHQTRLIDTTYAYEEFYKIERTIAYIDVGFENFMPVIRQQRAEDILVGKKYDEHGSHTFSSFRCQFFDYMGQEGRKFNYNATLHDPDTVFRLHIEYLDYGGIKTLGQYFMNQRHGIWNYYNDDGSLKDVELYSEGKKHYSLHDDNAFIYFHVLYDPNNGEVLQYKNDWVPDFNPDSTFHFNFNEYVWHRHERKKGGYLEFWATIHSLDKLSPFFKEYFRSLHRKTFYSDGRAKAIGFVTDKEEKTGVWIEFSHCGDTVIIYDKYYGMDNGLYRKYIKGELIVKRDEIPESRKKDPSFFRTLKQNYGPSVKRRAYWFRHWQEK